VAFVYLAGWVLVALVVLAVGGRVTASPLAPLVREFMGLATGAHGRRSDVDRHLGQHGVDVLTQLLAPPGLGRRRLPIRPDPVAPFVAPSLESAREKGEFARTRRRRWFDL